MNGYSPSLKFKVVTAAVHGWTNLFCRVDDAEMVRIPAEGPLIIISNHTNFLEAPVLYTRLRPRPTTGFAKIESWEKPLLAWLFNTWGIIPIRRGEADMKALRRGVAALKEGYFLAVAPEGTRSYDGRLGKAHAGAVTLALLSGAPLLPIAHYGAEKFSANISRLRRTEFHIQVGQPFCLDAGEMRVNREIRQQMTTEVMYQLAALMPAEYRGEYADMTQATQDYLRFT
ncbi:MAG: 1-acyl-sn-glycerol-3-phosphate acyltransferase [Anaerolineae bacterium]|nr:1-acyl-sn-glycerol-3-phosphate acyltransferase [Anaerolineae bacterium]